METAHNITVEEVIRTTDTFKKNLKAIILQRARHFRSKNDYRQKNRILPLPDDDRIETLARLDADRLVTLYIEVRERRSPLPYPARQTLSTCGDEAVKASMAEFTRKILRKPAEKPAEEPKAEKPKRKPATRKKPAKKAEK